MRDPYYVVSNKRKKNVSGNVNNLDSEIHPDDPGTVRINSRLKTSPTEKNLGSNGRKLNHFAKCHCLNPGFLHIIGHMLAMCSGKNEHVVFVFSFLEATLQKPATRRASHATHINQHQKR